MIRIYRNEDYERHNTSSTLSHDRKVTATSPSNSVYVAAESTVYAVNPIPASRVDIICDVPFTGKAIVKVAGVLKVVFLDHGKPKVSKSCGGQRTYMMKVSPHLNVNSRWDRNPRERYLIRPFFYLFMKRPYCRDKDISNLCNTFSLFKLGQISWWTIGIFLKSSSLLCLTNLWYCTRINGRPRSVWDSYPGKAMLLSLYFRANQSLSHFHELLKNAMIDAPTTFQNFMFRICTCLLRICISGTISPSYRKADLEADCLKLYGAPLIYEVILMVMVHIVQKSIACESCEKPGTTMNCCPVVYERKVA
jgi:hypothetical protein